MWVQNLFKVQNRPMALSTSTYHKNKVSDPTLQQTSKKLPFCGLWCSIKEKYPQLSNMAINRLLPFPTAYLCDARFSTKTRNHRT